MPSIVPKLDGDSNAAPTTNGATTINGDTGASQIAAQKAAISQRVPHAQTQNGVNQNDDNAVLRASLTMAGIDVPGITGPAKPDDGTSPFVVSTGGPVHGRGGEGSGISDFKDKYTKAKDKVVEDLTKFRDDLDTVLKMLDSHIHVQDLSEMLRNNQAARQHNACLEDRDKTPLMPLLNKDGKEIGALAVNILTLESYSDDLKKGLLMATGTDEVFLPVPPAEINHDEKHFTAYSRALTKQLRVAVGLPPVYIPVL